jgi:hypothetical protein
MEDVREVRWGCGCHEVGGKLEVQCTQVPPQGEMRAEQHAVAQPYSSKCFRLANQAQAAAEPADGAVAANEATAPTSEPTAAAVEPASTSEPAA